MRPLRPFVLAAALVASAVPTLARADLPPPDDQKFVGYSFAVTGLAASPDRVFFAFPCGGSSGSPIKEHAKLAEGVPVSVGRRGGDCKIYSIAKADYEAWAKDYTPTMSTKDPALDKLAGQSLQCQGAPAMTFTLPKADSRSSIQENLELKTSTATSCVLVSKGIGGGSGAAGGNGSGAPPGGSAPKSKSGCATVPGAGGACGLAFAALACAALLAGRRRR